MVKLCCISQAGYTIFISGLMFKTCIQSMTTVNIHFIISLNLVFFLCQCVDKGHMTAWNKGFSPSALLYVHAAQGALYFPMSGFILQHLGFLISWSLAIVGSKKMCELNLWFYCVNDTIFFFFYWIKKKSSKCVKSFNCTGCFQRKAHWIQELQSMRPAFSNILIIKQNCWENS